MSKRFNRSISDLDTKIHNDVTTGIDRIMTEVDMKIDKSRQQMKNLLELDVKRIEEKSNAIIQKTDMTAEKGVNKAIYDIWDHLYTLEKKVSDIKLDTNKTELRLSQIQMNPPKDFEPFKRTSDQPHISVYMK